MQKHTIDTQFKFNMGYFLVSYAIICFLSYDYLTHHAFHQHPVVFLGLFGLLGGLFTFVLTRLSTFIPIKLFLTNVLAAYGSALIYIHKYEECFDLSCQRGFIDHLSLAFYLLIILKLIIVVVIMTTIYILQRWISSKNKTLHTPLF